MANSITTHTTFTTKTVISSADMNTNFVNVISGAPFWQKYTVTYTDINTTTAAHTATLYNLDPMESILAVAIKHSIAFAGTSISTITASIGIASAGTKHVDNFDVRQSVGDSVSDNISLNLIESFASTTPVYATFTAAGANLDSLTAGSVDVWIL